MTSWPPDDDERLLAELGEALREPVPPDFLAAARAAYAWRTVDAELAVAALVFDSACDAEPAGQTRSAGSVRTLTFTAGPVVVEVEVTGTGLVGQLSPAAGGTVSGQSTDGVFGQAAVDPLGFFSLAAPPAGPVRLRAQTPRYTIATSWVSLS